MRVVLIKKKKPNRWVSMEDEAFNGKVTSDMILVEKFFGWVVTVWELIYLKYS